MLTHESGASHDGTSIYELLNDLTELRELDKRRNAHAPGSPAHDRATRELENRTSNLMDRFRDIQLFRPRPAPATALHLARARRGTTIGATRTG